MAPGFSLLEVLVALSIFAVVLLGLSAAEIHCLQGTQAAALFMKAVARLQTLTERIDEVENKTPLSAWQAENVLLLPQGHALLTRQGETATLELMWNDAASTCAMTQIGMRGCINATMILPD